MLDFLGRTASAYMVGIAHIELNPALVSILLQAIFTEVTGISY